MTWGVDHLCLCVCCVLLRTVCMFCVLCAADCRLVETAKFHEKEPTGWCEKTCLVVRLDVCNDSTFSIVVRLGGSWGSQEKS